MTVRHRNLPCIRLDGGRREIRPYPRMQHALSLRRQSGGCGRSAAKMPSLIGTRRRQLGQPASRGSILLRSAASPLAAPSGALRDYGVPVGGGPHRTRHAPVPVAAGRRTTTGSPEHRTELSAPGRYRPDSGRSPAIETRCRCCTKRDHRHVDPVDIGDHLRQRQQQQDVPGINGGIGAEPRGSQFAEGTLARRGPSRGRHRKQPLCRQFRFLHPGSYKDPTKPGIIRSRRVGGTDHDRCVA